MRAGSLDSLALKTEVDQIRCNVDKLNNEVSGLSKNISVIAEDIRTTLRYVSQMAVACSSTSGGEQLIGDGSSCLRNLNSPDADKNNVRIMLPVALISRSQSHSGPMNSEFMNIFISVYFCH